VSDLTGEERRHLLKVVVAVELVVRKLMQPDKINLASLGNVVPHLHWHVIPRWAEDSHFPAPIWAAAVRSAPVRPQPQSKLLAAALRNELGESQ
jgi:diadenosine tetraphosphate (Ap4A) HIT family hydrolase